MSSARTFLDSLSLAQWLQFKKHPFSWPRLNPLCSRSRLLSGSVDARSIPSVR